MQLKREISCPTDPPASSFNLWGGRTQTTIPTTNSAPDVLVQNFGSIIVLWPRTESVKDWFDTNVDTQQTWGAGTVCEPQYAHDIVDALSEAGFEVLHG
jgi:hypothetical protein